uniref:HEAT repeat domain-containing protein n=1 Tax=Streptomyces polyasparticus TaxID=2767826 RepID=UPI001F266BA9|nr:HEAT repeat domain-containing protein [Streptomyces polyasparticus]
MPRTSYEKEAADLLAAWIAEGEGDPEVLADALDALDALSETTYGGQEAVGLRYLGHSAAVVRARVPSLLLGSRESGCGPAARAALLRLAEDEDARVRGQAGLVLALAHDGSPAVSAALVALLKDPDAGVRCFVAEYAAPCPDRTPALADALVDLLHEGDLNARLNAVHGLLLREDPRTARAIDGLGPLSVPHVSAHDHRVSAIRTWRWKREHAEPPDA